MAEAARRKQGDADKGAEAPVILLVDDEAAVRDVAERMLHFWNYRVLAASTPGDALALADAPEQRIDLLLTDLSMPQMNGLELAQVVRQARPQLRVLVTSGYDPDSLAGGAGHDEWWLRFLPKPYGAAALRGAVSAMLAEA